jgi:prepilin-type processing-associated H-X9-DG protein
MKIAISPERSESERVVVDLHSRPEAEGCSEGEANARAFRKPFSSRGACKVRIGDRPGEDRRHEAGFALRDLLAILAMLALLLTLYWPALGQTHLQGSVATCLDNLRRLAMAWTLFAEDNAGTLPRNISGGPSSQPGWVTGWLSYDPASDNTNTLYLIDSRYAQLGSYTRDAALYRCPGDESQVRIGGALRDRVRSYSMNNAMNPDSYEMWLPAPQYRTFSKLSAINDPPPSRCYVFLEEHPDSINDGYFAFQMPASPDAARMVDFPASAHNGAGSFAFADTHAELHLWQDARTSPRVQFTPLILNVAQPCNPDLMWMAARCTSKAQ